MHINQDFTQDRSQFIGGSDVAAILGLSPYRTPIDVWLEKTKQADPKESNLAMRFGNYAEDFVAKEYSLATGKRLMQYARAITHTKYDFFKAHIDRFILKDDAPTLDEKLLATSLLNSAGIDKTSIESILECKTANPFWQAQWGEPGSDQVPVAYLCQCAWYMAITQLDQMDLAVLFGNQDFRVYKIERDLELENHILERMLEFWMGNVTQNLTPKITNLQDCQQLFSKGISNKKIQVSKTTLGKIHNIPKLQQQLQSIEKEIDLIKQAVMQEMQDAEILADNDVTLATWKSPKASTRIDVKRLQHDYPDLIKDYQIPIANSRRLVIKEMAPKVHCSNS